MPELYFFNDSASEAWVLFFLNLVRTEPTSVNLKTSWATIEREQIIISVAKRFISLALALSSTCTHTHTLSLKHPPSHTLLFLHSRANMSLLFHYQKHFISICASLYFSFSVIPSLFLSLSPLTRSHMISHTHPPSLPLPPSLLRRRPYSY